MRNGSLRFRLGRLGVGLVLAVLVAILPMMLNEFDKIIIDAKITVLKLTSARTNYAHGGAKRYG